MADLEQAKRRLVEALRERTPRYWDLMKSWYKRKISKDDFDSKAKALLGDEGIQLHNNFLFAILIKCQTPQTEGLGLVTLRGSLVQDQDMSLHGEVQHKRMKLDQTPAKNITPYGVFNDVAYAVHSPAMVCGKDLDRLLLCSHELLLPDIPTLHTRILLMAWENGLDGGTEEVARYMSKAVEYFLKSVLTSCITNKTSWKLRSEHFQHGFGEGFNPVLSSVSMETLGNLKNRSLAYEASMAELSAKTPRRERSEAINLFHLRDSLISSGTVCIPSHSVKVCNMERILGNLWHPSKSEVETQDVIKKWHQHLLNID